MSVSAFMLNRSSDLRLLRVSGIMVANKYAFLQITRRRFLNEWEAFKKVISRRNIRRRITIPLTLSNLKLLRRITRTENILHRNRSEEHREVNEGDKKRANDVNNKTSKE